MHRVLIVEDNPVNLELLRELLAGAECHIAEAYNGQEALEVIQSAQPDVVLLDINMPVLDGFGVIKAIRANPTFAQVPVMAITGHAMQEDVQKIFSVGFDSCITKPINAKTFFVEFHRLIHRRTDTLLCAAVHNENDHAT